MTIAITLPKQHVKMRHLTGMIDQMAGLHLLLMRNLNIVSMKMISLIRVITFKYQENCVSHIITNMTQFSTIFILRKCYYEPTLAFVTTIGIENQSNTTALSPPPIHSYIRPCTM